MLSCGVGSWEMRLKKVVTALFFCLRGASTWLPDNRFALDSVGVVGEIFVLAGMLLF